MKKPTLPKPLKKSFVHQKFQDNRSDPYHWMREKNSPVLLRHLQKESAYAKQKLSSQKALKEEIFNEIASRIPLRHDTEPVRWRDYWYFRSWKKGQNYPIHKRKQKKKRRAEILLDENQLAQGKSYLDVGDVQVSPDHNILAYAVDTRGREFFQIFFKNLRSGKPLPFSIKNVTSDFVWGEDNESIFYVKQDLKTLRPFKVFRFSFSTQKSDLVFEEKDTTFNVHLHKSLSKEYIAILTKSIQTSEWHFSDGKKTFKDFKLFLKRKKNHLYYLDGGEGFFYILTNQDFAFNFKLMKAPARTFSDSNSWKELIPHNKNVFLEDLYVFKNFVALKARENGQLKIFILNKTTNRLHKVPFSESLYACNIGENAEYQTSLVRLNFSSPLMPLSVYDYNVQTGKLKFLSQAPIKGVFAPDNYICKRDWAKAKDGTQIPLTVIHKKGLNPSPQTPLLLYGYGSYGYSLDPWFEPAVFPLLDRGFVYAVTHIRGGGELGKKWYENGKLLKKKNTFWDFIASAKHFQKKAWTSPKHLYAMGGSAGGLLIGAVANQRPDLFHGMVASVPFVDVLSTMLDETIPLSSGEYEEWGNPNKKKFYDYMKSYSPYDNVQKTSYPHMLIKTGYHDPRVQYWEPAKWVARLRERKTDKKDLLFLIDMKSGHFGATGRYERIKTMALFYAFFLTLESKHSSRSSS